jgi:Helix-hairpin-helix motif
MECYTRIHAILWFAVHKTAGAMKARFCLSIILLWGQLVAQTLPLSVTDVLEKQNSDAPVDEERALQLTDLNRSKINLNAASREQMEQSGLFSAIEIDNLVEYRSAFGQLLDIYELQAVPGLSIARIREVLPFITVTDSRNTREVMKERLKSGDQTLMLRTEYRTGDSLKGALGAPIAVRARYGYNFRNILQYGFTADKDAFEPFSAKGKTKGFDFYSFHFFARTLGMVKAVAIGDYRVNIGQGLIQWQGLSFGKSANVSLIKREAEVISPYRSAAEYNFYRGVATTLNYRHWELTTFASLRKLSGNLVTDSINHASFISSIQNTGYHRTASELADKNVFSERAAGAVLRYNFRTARVAVNHVMYQFSIPIQKNPAPYNLYSISGSAWSNSSADVVYTMKNVHLFGEIAIDARHHHAWVAGALISLDKRLDVALLARNLSSEFQSLHADAFTDNYTPTNEQGVYAGMTWKISKGLLFNTFLDVFGKRWPKYGLDVPSTGVEWLGQLQIVPDKQNNITATIRRSTDLQQFDASAPLSLVSTVRKTNFRLHFNSKISSRVSISHRIEVVCLARKIQQDHCEGFFSYLEATVNNILSSVSFKSRWCVFQTDDYDSRVYAFEESVPYNFSVPAFAGKGFGHFITIQKKFRIDSRRPYKITLAASWRQLKTNANEVLFSSGVVTSTSFKNTFNLLLLIFL